MSNKPLPLKASPHPAGKKAEPKPGERNPSSVDLSSPRPSTKPKMPHERDETQGMTDGNRDAKIEQGFEDVQSGKKDTSRADEADAAYHRQTRPD